MGKFVNLVKNEYIKLFSKVSTWIMVGIILVFSIGIPAMTLVEKYAFGYYDEIEESSSVEYYEEQIDYLKEVQTENWEQEVEALQFKIDNSIYEDDWRNTAVSQYFDLKSVSELTGGQTVDVQKLKSAIENDDWKSFYSEILSVQDYISGSEKAIAEYCVNNDVKPDSDNWKYNLIVQIEDAKEQIADIDEMREQGASIDSEEYAQLKDVVSLNQYRLDNNISYNVSERIGFSSGKFDFWSAFCNAPSIISFISVVIIIVCGAIVSNEFSAGTIKFLLINPVKRWKILVSKYFTSISIGYLLIIMAYIVSMVASMVMFGANNLSAPYISITDGSISSMPGLLYIFLSMLLKSVEMIVMATLAFAISSLARSSALAIGVSVMSYFGGSTVVMILRQLNFDWGRYLIFSNLSLDTIISGDPYYPGQTVLFAVAVIAVHMVIFALTAWDGFTRREV